MSAGQWISGGSGKLSIDSVGKNISRLIKVGFVWFYVVLVYR